MLIVILLTTGKCGKTEINHSSKTSLGSSWSSMLEFRISALQISNCASLQANLVRHPEPQVPE